MLGQARGSNSQRHRELLHGGTVQRLRLGTLIGTATLSSSGTAILPISNLPAGSYAITAIYNGNNTLWLPGQFLAPLSPADRFAQHAATGSTVTVSTSSTAAASARMSP